jgi:hypothetical protein
LCYVLLPLCFLGPSPEKRRGQIALLLCPLRVMSTLALTCDRQRCANRSVCSLACCEHANHSPLRLSSDLPTVLISSDTASPILPLFQLTLLGLVPCYTDIFTKKDANSQFLPPITFTPLLSLDPALQVPRSCFSLAPPTLASAPASTKESLAPANSTVVVAMAIRLL